MRLTEHTQTKMALGSDVSLTLVTREGASDVEALFTHLWRAIFEFERRFSRFLPASELSQINARAGLRTPISPAMHDLLKGAREMSTLTDGLYNPFILPALQRAGYVGSAAPGYEHDPVDNHSKRTVVDPGQLQLGDDWVSIPFDSALDLGGCGKGYLADALRGEVATESVHGYVFSLGGDVATWGRGADDAPWVIYIQEAGGNPNQHPTAVVCPNEGFGVATSGTFPRGNQPQMAKTHHIIDPATLQPAQTAVKLATVGAPRALVADVLASCAVILGAGRAHEVVDEMGARALLLQCAGDDKDYTQICVDQSRPSVLTSRPLGAVHA